MLLSSECGRGSGRHLAFTVVSACKDGCVFFSCLLISNELACQILWYNSPFSVPCCDYPGFPRAVRKQICKQKKMGARHQILLVCGDNNDLTNYMLSLTTAQDKWKAPSRVADIGNQPKPRPDQDSDANRANNHRTHITQNETSIPTAGAGPLDSKWHELVQEHHLNILT